MDEYLLKVASEHSDELVPDEHGIVAALSNVDERVKNALLAEIYRGEHTKVIAQLTRLLDVSTGREVTPERYRRCALEIRDRADDIHRAVVAERVRKEREEKRRQEAAHAALRKRHLQRLATRQDEIWAEIEELVSSTRQDSYDRAVKKLMDLRDIAELEDTQGVFAHRIDAIREEHSRKPSFIRRLEDAELI